MTTSGWAVGGGVPHSPAQARRLTAAATGGAEGVGGVGDLQVLPLATPGQGARVVRGSALIRSMYQSAETESYQGSVTEEELLATTPTGTGITRSDLVVMQVEDPWAAGSTWPPPPNPADAECFPIRVISGVPAGTTRLQDVPGYQSRTAVALARIDFPASTGTVTAGMITDLRKLATPRRLEGDARLQVTVQKDLTSATAVAWPGISTTVFVPAWATEMYVDAFMFGAQLVTSASAGYLWARLGTSPVVDSPKTYFNEQTVTPGGRLGWPVGGRIAIPENMRGRALPLEIFGNRSGGTGFLRAATDAQVKMSWSFTEAT